MKDTLEPLGNVCVRDLITSAGNTDIQKQQPPVPPAITVFTKPVLVIERGQLLISCVACRMYNHKVHKTDYLHVE